MEDLQTGGGFKTSCGQKSLQISVENLTRQETANGAQEGAHDALLDEGALRQLEGSRREGGQLQNATWKVNALSAHRWLHSRQHQVILLGVTYILLVLSPSTTGIAYATHRYTLRLSGAAGSAWPELNHSGVSGLDCGGRQLSGLFSNAQRFNLHGGMQAQKSLQISMKKLTLEETANGAQEGAHDALLDEGALRQLGSGSRGDSQLQGATWEVRNWSAHRCLAQAPASGHCASVTSVLFSLRSNLASLLL